MAAPIVKRSILLFCLKFALVAPACLVLWLLIMPYYAWAMGHVTSVVLHFILREPVSSMTVAKEGFLNTATKLTFVVDSRVFENPNIGHLVTNVAPFIALTLCTPGLGILRRSKILGIGVAIIASGHILTIALIIKAVRFSAARTVLPTSIGFVTITLPFLLWIVLAYWDKILPYFGDDDDELDDGADSADKPEAS